MTLLKSPALHMLVLGVLLYLITIAWNDGHLDDRLLDNRQQHDRTVLTIPQSRLAGMVDVFREDQGRSPDAAELGLLADTLIDQEVLFRYAIDLDMQQDPVVKRRLAQIAQFVNENPHESLSQEQSSQQAIELGLHKSDVIVRRILADGARRLIRAVVLSAQPSDQILEAYRLEHAKQFMSLPKTRITQVLINALAHDGLSKSHAIKIKNQIEKQQLNPEDAIALGDSAFVPGELPLLSDKDLNRHFGSRFVTALNVSPTNVWLEPLPSRYGHHIVYIHQRVATYLPPLSEIKTNVLQSYRHDVADKWLAFRLQQLRAQYDIVMPVNATPVKTSSANSARQITVPQISIPQISRL